MKKYSDFIEINEAFKSSVNIEYDLLKDEKLSRYIPTSDVCEVLTYYFDSIADGKINRSTVLEGPYGKGKSYLVLSLLQLLSLDNRNENVKAFLKKVKEIDSDLFKKIQETKKNGFKLLPVICISIRH